MPRLIVLGTGTGVGKTHVTVTLARALAELEPSLRISALKPIETGMGASGDPSDSDRLAAVARHVEPTRPHPLYAFAEPLTPYLAAAREGRSIELTAISRWVTSQQPTDGSVWQLIETAGGVFSPLSPSASNFELAQSLSPAVWVLVAPDALGVLHELRATLEALGARGRLPEHVVLSGARAPDASTGNNALVLRELGIVSPSAVLARNSSDLSVWARQLLQQLRRTAT